MTQSSRAILTTANLWGGEEKERSQVKIYLEFTLDLK
jgi:hypothetical protein